MISDVELGKWNRRGLIPGPLESEEAFVKRVGMVGGGETSCVPCFDLEIDWVEVAFDNRGLAPWHGGMTVVDGDCVRLQLRRSFKKGRFLFYRRDEVVAHELSHVGRCMFDEGCFEELIAYRTSRGFRRFLGPVIEKRWEVWALMGALGLGLWNPLVPLGVLFFGLARLFNKQRVFSRCLKKLGMVVDQPLAVAYRLTDREIVSFAKWKVEKVKAFIDRQSCLRWRMIRVSYLFDVSDQGVAPFLEAEAVNPLACSRRP